MAKPQKIERLYAWIATLADGEEGVPAIASPDGPLPLVGANRERIESLREYAREAARRDPNVIAVRLVCFDHLVEIERLADA